MPGLVLVRTDGPSVILAALEFGLCTESGCEPEPVFRPRAEMVSVFGLEGENRDGERSYQLPAGSYDLHVIADGAPVNAWLRLDGLGGRSVLEPTVASQVVLRNVSSTVPTIAGARPIYSAGASAKNGSNLTLMAHAYVFDIRPHVRHSAGMCYYQDRRPPMELNAPPCLFGTPGFGITIQYPTLRFRGAGWGIVLGMKPPGSWYQGLYLDGIQGEADISTSLLWMDLLSGGQATMKESEESPLVLGPATEREPTPPHPVSGR